MMEVSDKDSIDLLDDDGNGVNETCLHFGSSSFPVDLVYVAQLHRRKIMFFRFSIKEFVVPVE